MLKLIIGASHTNVSFSYENDSYSLSGSYGYDDAGIINDFNGNVSDKQTGVNVAYVSTSMNGNRMSFGINGVPDGKLTDVTAFVTEAFDAIKESHSGAKKEEPEKTEEDKSSEKPEESKTPEVVDSAKAEEKPVPDSNAEENASSTDKAEVENDDETEEKQVTKE